MAAYIKVENASLEVPEYLQRERHTRNWASLFVNAVFNPPKRRFSTLLEDLTFEINKGDRLAILGRNGAGKSTLLRMLNGVYAPTSGRVVVEGTRSAMLNIALGFSGDATVRENIFLRGTAMGLSSSFLRQEIIPILEFADLMEKANHRLQTLSAGQKMRLGFAISTCTRYDIVLMDEWIGTGDGNFVDKAKNRMMNQIEGNTIVALASHSAGLLRAICNKGIVLEQGRMIYAGDIVSSLKYYHEHLAQLREKAAVTFPDASESSGNIYGCVENIHLEMGVLHLKGWLASTDGPQPGQVVMEVDGARFSMRSIERYNRPDVVSHLGLSSDGCGFNATFTVPKLLSVRELGRSFQVFGGIDAAMAAAPLRLAPAVLHALERGGGTSNPPSVHSLNQ